LGSTPLINKPWFRKSGVDSILQSTIFIGWREISADLATEWSPEISYDLKISEAFVQPILSTSRWLTTRLNYQRWCVEHPKKGNMETPASHSNSGFFQFEPSPSPSVSEVLRSQKKICHFNRCHELTDRGHRAEFVCMWIRTVNHP
jgi:hypothetical protein